MGLKCKNCVDVLIQAVQALEETAYCPFCKQKYKKKTTSEEWTKTKR